MVALVAALSASCASTSQLALPGSLRDQADRYSVGGHVAALQRKLRFGPYTATKAFIYKSEDHRQATLFNGQQESFEAHHHGKLELRTHSGTFLVRCEQVLVTATQHEKSLQYERVNGSSDLYIRDDVVARTGARAYRCAIGQQAGEELRLTHLDDSDGTVEGAGVHWRFRAVYRLEQPPALAAGLQGGFVVREGDLVLGVVDASYERASVTIARGLAQTTRDRFAAVAAALLLLRDM
jgi:hypothetical protein